MTDKAKDNTKDKTKDKDLTKEKDRKDNKKIKDDELNNIDGGQDGSIGTGHLIK